MLMCTKCHVFDSFYGPKDERQFGYREISGLIGGLSATTRRRAVACKQVSKVEDGLANNRKRAQTVDAGASDEPTLATL